MLGQDVVCNRTEHELSIGVVTIYDNSHGHKVYSFGSLSFNVNVCDTNGSHYLSCPRKKVW